MNLLLDSGPCCVSSCGPFRLHIHTSPLWYKPSMSNSLPSSCVFFLPTVFLFWRFDSFNTSLFFCCMPGSATCTQSLCSYCRHCLSTENVSQIRKKNKKRGFLPPYVPCSNPPPALTSSPVPPSFSLGVPLSTELQAVITENELCNLCEWRLCVCECVCRARAEILKTNLPVLFSVHRCGNF